MKDSFGWSFDDTQCSDVLRSSCLLRDFPQASTGTT